LVGKGDGFKLESRGTTSLRPPEVKSRSPGTRFGDVVCLSEWQRRMHGCGGGGCRVRRRHSRPRRMVQDVIGAFYESLCIATGPAFKQHPRGKTLQSFAGNICEESAPHQGGGREGARERTNRRRAPQKPEQGSNAAALCSPRHSTPARSSKDSREWTSRLLLLQTAMPKSQDSGFEATPCGAVSRVLMGRGFRAQRGRERAGTPLAPPYRASCPRHQGEVAGRTLLSPGTPHGTGQLLLGVKSWNSVKYGRVDTGAHGGLGALEILHGSRGRRGSRCAPLRSSLPRFLL